MPSRGLDWALDSAAAAVTQPGVSPVGSQHGSSAGGSGSRSGSSLPMPFAPLGRLTAGNVVSSQVFGSTIGSGTDSGLLAPGSSHGDRNAGAFHDSKKGSSSGASAKSTSAGSQNLDKLQELVRRRLQLETDQERLKVEEYLVEQKTFWTTSAANWPDSATC